jgi:hypothetical protein
MACTIGDVIVRIARPSHQLQDRLNDLLVVPLTIGTNQVGLADLAFLSDQQHSGAVIINMDPVANVQPGPIKLRSAAVQDVGDLPRNELLDVLVGTVVVRTVAQSGLHSEGADPGAHQVIRAGLGRGVGAGGVVGRQLGKSVGILERQLAVHLIGGDVVVARAVPANGLQQRVGPDQVGGDERRRVPQ